MKKISKFILIIILFFTASCGFKVLDKSNKNNFEIIEVNTNGNSRINYRIKSFLLENSQQNPTHIPIPKSHPSDRHCVLRDAVAR